MLLSHIGYHAMEFVRLANIHSLSRVYLSFDAYWRASPHGAQPSNQVTLPETGASFSSLEDSAARRFGIRHLGNRNSRSLSLALWSCDLEFPMEQLRSAAISWC